MAKPVIFVETSLGTINAYDATTGELVSFSLDFSSIGSINNIGYDIATDTLFGVSSSGDPYSLIKWINPLGTADSGILTYPDLSGNPLTGVHNIAIASVQGKVFLDGVQVGQNGIKVLSITGSGTLSSLALVDTEGSNDEPSYLVFDNEHNELWVIGSNLVPSVSDSADINAQTIYCVDILTGVVLFSFASDGSNPFIVLDPPRHKAFVISNDNVNLCRADFRIVNADTGIDSFLAQNAVITASDLFPGLVSPDGSQLILQTRIYGTTDGLILREFSSDFGSTSYDGIWYDPTNLRYIFADLSSGHFFVSPISEFSDPLSITSGSFSTLFSELNSGTVVYFSPDVVPGPDVEVPNPNPPRNVVAISIESNQVTLSWDSPEDNGIEIVGYRVSDGTNAFDLPNQNSYIFSNLIPFRYIFSVIALSVDSESIKVFSEPLLLLNDLQNQSETQGTARVIQQYRDAVTPGVLDIVSASEDEVLDLLNALNTFDTELTFPDVKGANLDLFGKIIGEARRGRTDAVYLLWILGRNKASRSNGSINEIIEIADILTRGLATITLTEGYPAKFTIKVNGVVIDNPIEFASILKIARKAGVKANFEFSTAPTGEGFSFAGGTGKGFPDTSLTLGSGGKFASSLPG